MRWITCIPEMSYRCDRSASLRGYVKHESFSSGNSQSWSLDSETTGLNYDLTNKEQTIFCTLFQRQRFEKAKVGKHALGHQEGKDGKNGA
jgi:hypothetical protein